MGHGFRLAHPRIRFAAARLLACARGDDAGLDGGRAFAVRRIGPEFMRRQSRYVHMQVDTVQQRARQSAAVTPDQVGPAAAATAWVARPSAWARIHGGHELEAGREFCGPRGARDGDRPGFQRLAQDFQRGTRPFRLELSKVRCCIHLITTDRR